MQQLPRGELVGPQAVGHPQVADHVVARPAGRGQRPAPPGPVQVAQLRSATGPARDEPGGDVAEHLAVPATKYNRSSPCRSASSSTQRAKPTNSGSATVPATDVSPGSSPSSRPCSRAVRAAAANRGASPSVARPAPARARSRPARCALRSRSTCQPRSSACAPSDHRSSPVCRSCAGGSPSRSATTSKSRPCCLELPCRPRRPARRRRGTGPRGGAPPRGRRSAAGCRTRTRRRGRSRRARRRPGRRHRARHGTRSARRPARRPPAPRRPPARPAVPPRRRPGRPAGVHRDVGRPVVLRGAPRGRVHRRGHREHAAGLQQPPGLLRHVLRAAEGTHEHGLEDVERRDRHGSPPGRAARLPGDRRGCRGPRGPVAPPPG